MSLRNLTVSQLETLQTNLIAAHAKALEAESYGIGGRSLKRTSAAEIMKQLKEVGAELAARANTDGGVILVEFGEPE